MREQYEQQLSRLVANTGDELSEAVHQLRLASQRQWSEQECDALDSFLDHFDLTIEVWLRRKS